MLLLGRLCLLSRSGGGCTMHACNHTIRGCLGLLGNTMELFSGMSSSVVTLEVG